MSRIDFKNGHRDILNRRTDDWQDGWQKNNFALGIAWGVVIVVAILAFWR